MSFFLRICENIASWVNQCGPSQCQGLFLGVAPAALLCLKEPVRSKQKAPSRGLWMGLA